MPYPVSIAVTPALTGRNRLTTLFRAILAIPHVILVGGVGMGAAYSKDTQTSFGAEGGLLGAVVFVLVVISWFTILFAGSHLPGIRQFTQYYLRWRTRALAYVMLLTDAYPPFGDGAYPATFAAPDSVGPRRRLSVAFRIFLAIPHFIVLSLVLLGWYLVTIGAWFAILLTGRYPQAFYDFAVGALRWRLRLDAYLLLLVDDYPPFSLQ